MRKPDYKLGDMINAIRSSIEPEVYDDVVAWDDNGSGLVAGLLLSKSDTNYEILAYFDKPEVFTWEHAVKIEV